MMNNPLGWQVYTLADAYQPRPQLRCAIAGLFSLPSLNIVYGAPGSLKSMLMADAALCIATGTPWLPGLTDASKNFAVTQMPALWIDFDNGKRRTDERFDALGTVRQAPPDAPLYYCSMPWPWLDMTKTSMVLEMIDTIKQIGAGFVVTDNLGVVSGNADENTVDMIRVMGNLRLVAERTNSAVVVVHHQRKGKQIGGREGDNLRGHSCIEASLDLALWVERETNSATISVTATKARGFDVNPFGAIFSYEHRKGSTEMAEARFWGVDIDDRTSDLAIEEAIIEALEVGELRQSELVKTAKANLDVGRPRIMGKLAQMVKDGKVKSRKGLHNSTLYSLP